jgi:hypothetical protein
LRLVVGVEGVRPGAKLLWTTARCGPL